MPLVPSIVFDGWLSSSRSMEGCHLLRFLVGKQDKGTDDSNTSNYSKMQKEREFLKSTQIIQLK